MLKTFRANRNKLLGLFVVGVCAFLMAGFGLSSFFGPQQRGPIAKVGDYEISYQEFRRRHEQLRGVYRQRFGENFAALEGRLNLRQQAIDALINDRVIELFTEQMGLSASKTQIEQQIVSNPFFGGTFSKASYQTFLRSTGLTGGQLERLTRDQIVREQLLSLMKTVSTPSAGEIEAMRVAENTAVILDFVEIDPASFTEEAKQFDNAALEEFYNAQKTRYQVPRQIKLSYLQFSPEQYADKVEVLDEDIRIFYEENQRKFATPREYHLKQILFKKPAEDKKEDNALPFLEEDTSNDASLQSTVNSLEAVRARAKSARERLEAGEDFSTLAAELSEDPATKDKGGSLGFVSVKKLDPKIRQVADELAIDDFSDVLDLGDSLVIIYVQDMKESSVKPLAEVRDEIIQALKKIDAPLFAFEAAEAVNAEFMAAQNEGDSNLKTFANAKELPLKSSDGFVGFNKPGSVSLQLLKDTLELEQGDVRLLEIGDEAYIVEVEEVKEAHVPALAEIRETVENDYIKNRERELAQLKANSIIAELNADESSLQTPLRDLKAVENLTIQQTKETLKKSPPEGIFMLPNLREQAFRVQEEGTVIPQVFPYTGKFIVAALAKRTVKEVEEAEVSEINSISDREANNGSERLFQSLVELLRAQQEIWVDTEQLLASA